MVDQATLLPRRRMWHKYLEEGNKIEANVKEVVWKWETALTWYVSVRFTMSQFEKQSDKLMIRIACQTKANLALNQNKNMQRGIYLTCHESCNWMFVRR